MRYFKILCMVLCSIFLFGCFQTIWSYVSNRTAAVLSKKLFCCLTFFWESFQELSKGFADDEDKTKNEAKIEQQDPVQGMIKDARSKENQFGPGVKFISAIPLKTETMSGYKAIYAFKDINTLKVNQNPGNKTKKSGTGEEKTTEEENILFKLKKGPVSTLTVTMPEGIKPERKIRKTRFRKQMRRIKGK